MPLEQRLALGRQGFSRESSTSKNAFALIEMFSDKGRAPAQKSEYTDRRFRTNQVPAVSALFQ